MKLLDYDIKDDSFYLFTCAQLKAKEAEFIDKSKIERLLGASGLDEFIRVLRDTVYSDYAGEVENSASFESVILGEYKNIADFLDRRLKHNHRPAGELLFFEENLHNIKTVIKSIIMDVNLEELYIPVYYSYGELRDATVSGDYREISSPVSNTLRFAGGEIDRQENRRILEFEIEKFYLQELFNSIKKIQSRLIMDYLRHVVDILNIKNIYRNKYLDEDLAPALFLHNNGFVPVELIMKFRSEQTADLFFKKIKQSDYADIVAKGADVLNSQNSFVSFDKEEVLFYIELFEPLKYTVSNVEKVFQFFLRKKIELKKLNIIFEGVLYGISAEKIKDRVLV
ncbi:MAG: V-type ATPase subunit [Actinomycetota bacterium]|nr:V-type ATPase subunit [Actinomycetota bacterium]